MAGEYWWEPQGWRKDLVPYVILLEAFIEGRLSGTEFEEMFLATYKRDPTIWSENIFETLEKLFVAVDDYCADPAILQQVGGLDVDGLRTVAKQVLRALRESGLNRC